MCGIVGAVGADIDERRFAIMLAALQHRGPDACGSVAPSPGCRLGHTRLAIVDTTTAGQQPFCADEAGVWALVNGEIYNYRELRSLLQQQGYHFRSDSDSEVVLHGYLAWGGALVSRLRGIFAFAVYDRSRERLLLVRDAAGVKPLYYERAAQGLLFASELKALRVARRSDYEIEAEAIWSYLSYRYVPGELTPYRNVYKLPPAHQLIWEKGAVKVTRWWTPEPRSKADVGQLREVVRDSVRAQLMSDVPIGVLLSGGIDSSAVIALATNGKPLDAFCCGFSEAGYDERPYARAAAEFCGARLHEMVMDRHTLLASLPDFIDWFDEPFFDYSAIAVHLLCKLARDRGIKVLLAGDGADELFAGYLWYDDFSTQAIDNERVLLERFFSYNGYFTGQMLSELAGRPVDFDHLALLRRHDRPELPLVNRAQWLDFHCFLPEDILTKVDRASMALGVEVRVPLLDQRLLDECFLWPEQILYRGRERKHLFKRALADLLPEHILTPRKKGFGFPLEAWSRDILALAQRILPGGQLQQQGFACAKGIEDALERLNIHFVWLLLTAELWFRRFTEQEDLRTLFADPTLLNSPT